MKKNNIKYVAVNMDSNEGKELLKSSSNAVQEIDSELFTFGNAGHLDDLTATFAGQLADDPICYYKKKEGETIQKGKDPITDDKASFQVNVISTVKTWYDANGEIHKRSSRYRLNFRQTGFKKIISKLHKGDRVSGEGKIYSYSGRNSENPEKGVQFWYIEPDSITVNPYKTISKTAEDAFAKQNSSKRKYNDFNDIMSDDTLSRDEKWQLLQELNQKKESENTQEKENARSQYEHYNEPSQADNGQNTFVDAPQPTEEVSQNWNEPNYPEPENPNNQFYGPNDQQAENYGSTTQSENIDNQQLKNAFNQSF